MYNINPAPVYSRSRLRRSMALAVATALALTLTLALGGCAFAPGMYIGSSLQKEASASAQDAPPAGRLTAITPDLIRQQRAEATVAIGQDVQQLFDLPKTYRIGAGDMLNVIVWSHPELAIPDGLSVSQQGFVQFPYMAGVNLLSLTEYQARELFTQRLAKFIKDPEVTLRVQSYRSGRVYLDGEFRSPGLQALNDVPMTLPEAIGRAGGFTALADRSAVAITRNGNTVVVNLPQLTALGINPAKILLSSGDLVNVPNREESKVFVMGEVLRPSTQTLRNGRLSLNEALGEAGGVNPNSGDPRQIFIIRAANTFEPEIYHLDGSTPTAFALAEGFALRARDVIYVDPVPLVRWNRVITLMLPSALAVTTTRGVGNALN
jgi:polysaccharide export outer membrane protein